MMVSDFNKVDKEFTEAQNYWDLEKIYIDLGSAKGKSLTPVEKKFLRGLLCGFSPAEIANTVYQSRNSSTVRVYLSNGLYKYIEEILSHQAGYSIEVKSWSRVTHLLEKAGYKKGFVQIELANNPIKTKKTELTVLKAAKKEDWGEAVDVSLFYGRTTELAQMTEWIIEEHCRLIVILGMGGVGKTALSIKLAEQIKDKFDYVIWRSLTTSGSTSSLHLAPPPEVFLNQLIHILSPTKETIDVEDINSRISQLIDCLRSSRCLIVLDNFDSILCNEYSTLNDSDISFTSSINDWNINNYSAYHLPQIRYRSGYEGYGELMRRIGDSQHQSCLVVTSREKPQEVAVQEGERLPVRCLKLTGLSHTESRILLQNKGFSHSTEEEYKLLIDLYAGNSLFIKLAATAIQELFRGNIYKFLEQGVIVFGDIRGILDQQFNRLSHLEKLVMYWLAFNQDLGSVRKLQKDIAPQVSQRLILEAIELLHRRSFIEWQVSSFSQTPVLMEYVAERLIEENFKLRQEKPSSILMLQTVFETQIKNYVRDLRLNNEI
ncbi:ATP-binding protein [Brasilonema sp. UFV-L1]|uniref:NB-ARC domain-containing protein n=1 Tax=Brasilonema sp. UFV-L1 TaxID=2234130 RepID=UPI00145DE021|nr:ATP-binding protein [Brasilonema sp. UFV-L1]NMG10179.1 NB-ARC domain-containing protein [Brasilonema sp. UFV-L1]